MKHLIRVMRKHDLTNKDKDKNIKRTPSNDNPREVVNLLTFLTFENIKTLPS